MNDDPLMRVMRNIKTSPGPGVGEAIDKRLPPYASQADPLREALEKAFKLACKAACPSCAKEYPIDDGNDGMQDLRNGCYHPDRNYSNTGFGGGYHKCKAADARAAWKIALAQSPAPQGEGTREALEAAATVAENWQHTLIESCPNHMPVYPSIFFRDKAVADAIRALANTPKFMSATPIPSDRAGREEIDQHSERLELEDAHKHLDELGVPRTDAGTSDGDCPEIPFSLTGRIAAALHHSASAGIGRAAGLAEAAEWHEQKADEHSTRNFADQSAVRWHEECAVYLRTRAADKNAPLSPSAPSE